MATAIPLVFGIGGQFLGGKFLAGVGIGGHVLGTAGGTLVGGIGGMMLGSLLFPQESPSESLPKVGSYQTQTTLSGSAIPIVKGTCRVAGNIIYLGDSHPYTIVHKSGGGGGKGIFGGGGGSSVTTTETRYRRSFLIGICEGPATIGRIWRGKEEILTSECTIFDGDDNVSAGLAVVTGLEFGHYKHLCCAWFEEYDLGTSDSVPMFTFEVGGDTGFRICDLYACGYAKQIGSKYSIVEAFNAKGNYSHVVATGDQDSQAHFIRKHPTNGYCYLISDTGYYGGDTPKIQCVDIDSTIKWTNIVPFGTGSRVNSFHIGLDGYIYFGRGKIGSYPYNMLQKLNPLTGQVVWEAIPTSFGDVTGVGNGLCTYNSGTQSQLLSFNTGTGDTTLIKAVRYVTGVPIRGSWGLNHVTGTFQGHGCVWCIKQPELVEMKYYFEYCTVTKNIIVAESEGYEYVWVGVNHSAGPANYVAMLRYSMGFFYDLVKTYEVGGTIHDIVRDIDGGLLVCHDRGTGANGEIGHVTKLGMDLSYLGCLDFDNDRSGFVRSMARGSGTVILGSADVETVNPVDMMADILINKRIGGGFDKGLIDEDAFQTARQECEDNGIFIALSLDNKQPLLDWIDYIQSHYFGYLRLG